MKTTANVAKRKQAELKHNVGVHALTSVVEQLSAKILVETTFSKPNLDREVFRQRTFLCTTRDSYFHPVPSRPYLRVALLIGSILIPNLPRIPSSYNT